MPASQAVEERSATADVVAPPSPAEAQALRGNLDAVHGNGTLVAWCWSAAEPDLRREVAVCVDGAELARGLCNQLRPDLLAAGVGDGHHGLTLTLPPAATPPGHAATVTLRDVATGRWIGRPTPATWLPRPQAMAAAADQIPGPVAAGPLEGNVDRITRDGWVRGWCWRRSRPDDRVDLTVLVDGEPIGTTRASVLRGDLKDAGIGDGAHGFALALPWSVLAEKGTLQIAVRETGTGMPLGAPILTRAGRLAAAEERIQDLERQIQLLRPQLHEVNRHAQARDDDRAARVLLTTVADFFQALAQGKPGGGLKAALNDLTARLPPLALAIPAQPAATVCITAGATVETLYACLLALHETGVDAEADIVLIDDGAQGGEAALLPAVVRNLRYVRVPAGGNPMSMRNEVAQAARGGLLCFLAPQVRVAPGWLDELAATFAREPDAAAVGAKVVRDDGLLHHTGIVLHPDGQLRDPGALALADNPAHDFLCPVHGLGDVAFAVRRDRLAEAGGFSNAYAAAPHAVFDLCMRLRAGGHAVLYQPVARAAWSDGGAPDLAPVPDLGLPDEESRLLRQRWQGSAPSGDPAGGRSGPGFVGHALVIDTAIPRPDRDAGAVATLEQMLVLRGLGYRVTFVAAGGDDAGIAEAAVLRRQGIELAMPPHYLTAAAYLEAHGGALDLVQIHDTMNATPLLDRVRELAPQARVVFAPADLRGAEMRAQALDCIGRSDAAILASDVERDLLQHEVDPARLHMLRWIARPRPSPRGFAGRSGICFVGDFRHAPNVDGVLWFVTEILPLVRAQVPQLDLHLAGGDMPDRILALAAAGVVIHGRVPDPAPLYEQVRLSVAPLRLSVAPLRSGAGLRGEVATSLAFGVPVVGSAIALDGTGLAPGEGFTVAEDAATFAGEVVRLHETEPDWTGQAATALARCQALYSPDAARAVYRCLLAGLDLPLPPA